LSRWSASHGYSSETLRTELLDKDSQHGFRKGRSCFTNVLTFLDNITGSIDSGSSVDAVFLDFAIAFDKVPHKRLAQKHDAHGIDGLLLKWITEWLHGRQQRVFIRGTFSWWVSVLSGVPHQSVLGLLIYINDLDYGIRN